MPNSTNPSVEFPRSSLEILDMMQRHTVLSACLPTTYLTDIASLLRGVGPHKNVTKTVSKDFRRRADFPVWSIGNLHPVCRRNVAPACWRTCLDQAGALDDSRARILLSLWPVRFPHHPAASHACPSDSSCVRLWAITLGVIFYAALRLLLGRNFFGHTSDLRQRTTWASWWGR